MALRASEANALATVLSYNAAWTSGDLETARTYLADDLQFRGSIDTFSSAEPLIAALQDFLDGPYQGVQNVLSTTTSYNRVHLLYETPTAAGDLRFSETFWVEDGKVVRIELVFDPRALLPN